MSAARREAVERVEWPAEFHPQLSSLAKEFLRDNPKQAERVVAEALEAAATHTDAEDLPKWPFTPIPEALRPFIVKPETPYEDFSAGELLNLTEAAERLKVSRRTLYAWIRARKLIALPLTPTGAVVPAEQILGSGSVVPGLDRVLEVMPHPRLAWSFLTQELPFFVGEPRRPIDVLKEGDVEAVVKAADAYGSDFT